MFNQAAAAAFRILLFRAGPQDFPYSASLTQVVVAVALVAAFARALPIAAAAPAVVHAIASIGMLAVFTHVLLQKRGLANRFQQTLNSLLAVEIAVTPLVIGPVAALAPHIARSPDLAPADPPALPALAWLVVAVWKFLVTAHVYRHALDVQFGAGAIVAMLAAIVTELFAGAIAGLAL